MADDGDQGGGFGNFIKYHFRGLLVFLIPIFLLPILLSWPGKEGRALYIYVLIVVYNITEVMPIWVTGWLGPVLLPCFGLLSSEDTSKYYWYEPVSYMFGCYMIAISFENSGAHKRIAYDLLSWSGFKLRRLHFFVSLVTFIISLYFANTATVALMCPIVKVMLEEIHTEKIASMEVERDPEKGGKKELTTVGKAFYIGMAYSATLGGSSSIEGTATNYALEHYYRINYTLPGNKVDLTSELFFLWALIPSFLMLILIYFMLEVLYFGMFRPSSDISQQISAGNIEAAKANLVAKRNELGSSSFHEIMVLTLTCILIVLTLIRQPFIIDALPRKPITITSFVLMIVLLLFIIPSNFSFCNHFSGNGPFPKNTTKSLLVWSSVHKIFPWGLFFMLGCYLACAESANRNGLTRALENKLGYTEDSDAGSVQIMLVLITLICTAVIPNVATAHTLLPAFGRIAKTCKIHPLYLLLPTGYACNFSFLFPCGTPVNTVLAEYANIGAFFFITTGILPTIFSFIVLLISGRVLYPAFLGDAVDFPEA